MRLRFNTMPWDEGFDAEKFREALTGGIGRGKAYGLGLLTVVRP